MLEDDPAAWNEIGEWIDAALVGHTMEHNRLGVMGHYYGGMLDVYSDLTLQCATFGGAHRDAGSGRARRVARARLRAAEIERRVAHFLRSVSTSSPIARATELERAARTSVALDRLVERHRLGSLAYYYMRHRQRRQRRRHQLDHPRHQLLTGARHSGGGRMRSQERAGDEDHGRLRRRRLVHRILRHGLSTTTSC